MEDIMDKYKRQSSIPYPTKYHTFIGRSVVDNKLPKFVIQDLTDDMIDYIVDELVLKHFILEEPAHKYCKYIEDLISVEELRGTLKYFLNQQLGLVCLLENELDEGGNPIIAGFNVTYIKRKEDEEDDVAFDGEKFNELRQAVQWLEKNIKDPYEELQVNEYLGAYGLYVLKQYRGQGIGDELLKARIPLCKNIGMKFTVTTFTSPASQKIAERCGFQSLIDITFEELHRRAPLLFKYPDISQETKVLKVMYLLIE